MTAKHVLMRGDLKTRESEAVDGPRDTSFFEEANALNQKHYERRYNEYFGKPATGHYTPNKEYIWWSEPLHPKETEKSRDSSLSLIGKIQRDAKKILEADKVKNRLLPSICGR